MTETITLSEPKVSSTSTRWDVFQEYSGVGNYSILGAVHMSCVFNTPAVFFPTMKLSSLSAPELRQIANHLDRLNAGGEQ